MVQEKKKDVLLLVSNDTQTTRLFISSERAEKMKTTGEPFEIPIRDKKCHEGRENCHLVKVYIY